MPRSSTRLKRPSSPCHSRGVRAALLKRCQSMRRHKVRDWRRHMLQPMHRLAHCQPTKAQLLNSILPVASQRRSLSFPSRCALRAPRIPASRLPSEAHRSAEQPLWWCALLLVQLAPRPQSARASQRNFRVRDEAGKMARRRHTSLTAAPLSYNKASSARHCTPCVRFASVKKSIMCCKGSSGRARLSDFSASRSTGTTVASR